MLGLGARQQLQAEACGSVRLSELTSDLKLFESQIAFLPFA